MDHLRSGVRDKPGQHGETLSLPKNTKISCACWHVPVVPATQEAEAVELFEPRRWRLLWAKIMPLHSNLGTEQDSISKNKTKPIASSWVFSNKHSLVTSSGNTATMLWGSPIYPWRPSLVALVSNPTWAARGQPAFSSRHVRECAAHQSFRCLQPQLTSDYNQRRDPSESHADESSSSTEPGGTIIWWLHYTTTFWHSLLCGNR